MATQQKQHKSYLASKWSEWF